ncbi:GPR endopeptidase [Paenalkalicoccus suaedae]|uniref:Germination protease n=1 Tax=Paenalkalicoccus suaedae TaxID=2592382 RepID=A0A859FE27_9BACI|nr:GPR endopeptidase [Paenalkalicoccus suaedae]QKS70844.1 GPR endopeptidase [Paenalkalicoccus suaedae]
MQEEVLNIRTDLAVESLQSFQDIVVKEEELEGVLVSTVIIKAEQAKRIGKQAGTYITLHAKNVRQVEEQLALENALVKAMQSLLPVVTSQKDINCLIVGLGNPDVTPDALGPNTCKRLFVTHHLNEVDRGQGFEKVAVLTPGVMGTTGMETADIVKGVVTTLQPDFVIVIDALAARSIERVYRTIQLSDAGIHPGSGVGNHRKALTKESLGVPVLAVGIPTVVDAATIASDAIDFLLKHLGKEAREADDPGKKLAPAGFGTHELTDEDIPDEGKRKTYFGAIGLLSSEEKKQLILEALTPLGHNLMVTPKEVDAFIEDVADIVANGLNRALHPAIADKNRSMYSPN